MQRCLLLTLPISERVTEAYSRIHHRPGRRQAALQRDVKAAGAESIFGEQGSSTAKRAKLAEWLTFLREGDVLAVTRPDRLVRSAAELLSITHQSAT